MAEQKSESQEPACGCKLGRVAAKYDLRDIDEKLVESWTHDGDEQRSTRELATYVNQRTLEAAVTNAGISHKEGEIENTYRLLTSDDVTSGTRTETRNELEQDGVPIETVESDFVSHQTVYNHLTKCLEASIEPPSDKEILEKSEEKLGALQSRTVAVTTDTVEKLDRDEILNIGEFNVHVSVTVTCEDCFREYTVQDLLEQRRCECQEPDNGER
ncbi:rod-determining factor RdfA [Haloarcula laminariae]|uniref:rod-determining factor RdfA n=1 Tax=Haloarcula laminariae TaxID=2961577 RepID=UPI002406775F|nr:rod-determining factor RdfA [Halomicroarcula sp. FL173]